MDNIFNAPSANADITTKPGIRVWCYRTPALNDAITRIYGGAIGTFIQNRIGKTANGDYIIGVKFDKPVLVDEKGLKVETPITECWVYEKQVTWSGKENTNPPTVIDNVVKPPVSTNSGITPETGNITPIVKDPINTEPETGNAGDQSSLNMYLALAVIIVIFIKFVSPND